MGAGDGRQQDLGDDEMRQAQSGSGVGEHDDGIPTPARPPASQHGLHAGGQ